MNASLSGANTVNGPGPDSSSTSPAACTNRNHWPSCWASGCSAAWMMSLSAAAIRWALVNTGGGPSWHPAASVKVRAISVNGRGIRGRYPPGRTA